MQVGSRHYVEPPRLVAQLRTLLLLLLLLLLLFLHLCLGAVPTLACDTSHECHHLLLLQQCPVLHNVSSLLHRLVWMMLRAFLVLLSPLLLLLRLLLWVWLRLGPCKPLT